MLTLRLITDYGSHTIICELRQKYNFTPDYGAKIKILDCRGLACPQPVLNTRDCLAKATDLFDVLVDNSAAVENVSRFLSSQNCPFSIEKKAENNIVFHVRPNGQAAPQPDRAGHFQEQIEKILLFSVDRRASCRERV